MQNNVSKIVSIALAIVAGIFLVTAVIFAILYAMERYNRNFNQTQQGTYHEILSGENHQIETFIVNSDCNKQQ
jgi:archaellum component FlaF (FlaF/FlaG flagellin family)